MGPLGGEKNRKNGEARTPQGLEGEVPGSSKARGNRGSKGKEKLRMNWDDVGEFQKKEKQGKNFLKENRQRHATKIYLWGDETSGFSTALVLNMGNKKGK